MIRLLLLASVLLIVLLLVATSAALLGTRGGLQTGFWIADRLLPGELQVTVHDGRLIDGFVLRDFHYQDDDIEVAADQLMLSWEAPALLRRALLIRGVQIQTLQITTAATDADNDFPDPPLPLPLTIEIQALSIDTLEYYHRDTGEPLHLRNLHASIAIKDTLLALHQLSASGDHFIADAQGRVQLSGDWPLRLDFRYSLALPPEYAAGLDDLDGHGHVTGNRHELVVEHRTTAPLASQLDLTLNDVLGKTPAWHGRLQAQNLELQAYIGSNSRAELDLTFEGNPAGSSLSLHALLSGEIEADIAATTVLQHEDLTAIELISLQLEERQRQVGLIGQGRVSLTDAPLLELAADWQYQAQDPVTGKLRFTGTLADYQLELTALTDKPLVSSWVMTASGDQQHLSIHALRGELAAGEVHGDGRLDWSDQPRLTLDLEARHINPGVHWPDWPGQMDFQARLQLQQLPDDWQLLLTEFDLHGQLRDYPVQASGNLQAGANEYHFDQVDIRSADSRITLDGQISDNSQLQWRLVSPDLGQLLPETSGRINSEGQLRGRLPAPEITATINGEAIVTPWLSADNLVARLDLDISTDRFDADISGAGLAVAGQIVEQLQVHSRGTRAQHELQAELRTPEQQLRLAGQGSLQDMTWTLRLAEATIEDTTLGEWVLAPPLSLALSQSAVQFDSHCWHQQEIRFCADGDWQQAGDWQVNARLHDLDLPGPLPLPDAAPTLSGRLQGDLSARGNATALESLTGTVELANASIRPEGDIEPMQIDRLVLRFTDPQPGIRADIEAELGGTYPGNLRGSLRTASIPFDPDQLEATGLEGEINASLGDLGPLLQLYSDLDADRARAEMDVGIAGSLSAPLLTGTLQLQAERIFIVEAGLELTDFRLQLDGSPAGDITLQGETRSGPGSLKADGQLQVGRDGIHIHSLALQGENFEAVNLPEAWALTTLDLQVEQVEEVIRISGDVTIPEALLEPLEATGTIPVSADERIVGAEPEEERDPLQIETRIQLRLGDSVQLRGPGFAGRLTGTLELRQQPGRPVNADGLLTIVDGAYRAYGQELRMTTGEILYTGQAIDDPDINMRAVRQVETIQAGIFAHGSARRPIIELFSTPGMPDADILSYIVTGRPVSGLGAGEGNMLLEAATAMGISRADPLRQNIANTLGLDELTLTGVGPGQADTRVTVGKYLTPRLYLSYGAGLVESAVDTIRMRYNINSWLALEAEQGRGTGADLLYQIER